MDLVLLELESSFGCGVGSKKKGRKRTHTMDDVNRCHVEDTQSRMRVVS